MPKPNQTEDNHPELIGRFLRKDHLNQRLARSGIAHDHFCRIIFREIRPQFLQSITCESRANIEAKQTGRYIGRYGRCCLCCHNWRAIADCAALMQKPAQTPGFCRLKLGCSCLAVDLCFIQNCTKSLLGAFFQWPKEFCRGCKSRGTPRLL